MFRRLALAASCVVLMAAAADHARAPVLVELFTSEGCSSCPPADRLLQQMDASAIVLSEHVDYWDHQGWKDPFSSPAFTERQQSYTRMFHLDGPYTPEMVLDGAVEFVGNDASRAARELTNAAHHPKAEVHLARTPSGVQIDADAAAVSADVLLALADDSGASQVAAGENKGRNLSYVAIVRTLRKIGSVKRGAAFHREIELPRSTAAQRIVVFLQESGPGRVSGAAMLEPYNPAP
ncbi:MAG TPA: DUF1223 domain-containing protein [Bryobacteraceae bacterium]|nr:DUF1223 domain-containing protein [Bryobacteraceae bacterium]